jgi:PPM family protein phosphatase
MNCSHSARTDVGRHREHNEDDYGVGEGLQTQTHGQLFVVCDGMGGHEAGEVASRLAVENIITSFYALENEERPVALSLAFESANAAIFNEGTRTNISMGTTGVAAAFYGDTCAIANVGDSRAYIVRDGAIRQISRDHSLVSEQIAAGMISVNDAEKMFYRHVITRALGHQPDVVVDMFTFTVQVGDRVLLATDGLINHVDDAELVSIISQSTTADATERLIDLANERGGSDNITALVVSVDSVSTQTSTRIPLQQLTIAATEYTADHATGTYNTAAMRLMLAPQLSWQGAGLSVALLAFLSTLIVLGLLGWWPFRG